MWRRLRAKTYWLLFSGEGAAKSLDVFIIALIGLNVVMVVLETEGQVRADYETFFVIFEWFSSIFFSVEYVLRLWSCVEDPRYARAVRGRVRYALTPMALVDLIAVAPFYVELIAGGELDTRVVRAIRMFRLFRLFKIGRYAHAITALGRVFSRKKEQLAMTFFTVTMMLILCSSVMYFAEHGNPAHEGKHFTSIVDSMWWAAITLTTVGYGDAVPMTGIGKLLGAVIAFMGVIIIALPAGIVASGFAEEMDEKRRAEADEALAAEKAAADARAATAQAAPIAHAHTVDGAFPCPHCGGGIALQLAPAPPSSERS